MEKMMSLRGKVIVVTCAAQGIGRAIAASAIDLSAMVVGVDLNAEKLEALATAKNGQLLPYVGSVADRNLPRRRYATSIRVSAPYAAFCSLTPLHVLRATHRG
jgi:NAD(P)-dependent dehydrogenase (short-subunit alcohol dehydrogenase family)